MDPRSLIDDLLEIAVVPSFTTIGPAVRRRLFHWADAAPDALRGRTVLVTGPTSGLGRAATDSIAALGARVVLVGRSQERLAAVRDALVQRHGQDRYPIVVADMGSLASVRAAVTRVLETEERLDVLVDNAGAIFPERTMGVDGIEATLATLVVGPFVLESGLMPLLRQTSGSRVIAVTSGGMYTQQLDVHDLQYAAGTYNGSLAYARSKRAQVALMREWSRRSAGWGVAFAAMHPGWADTPGLAESLPAFQQLMRPLLRTPAQGVETIVWLAALPDASPWSGRLLLDRRSRPFDRVPMTRLSAAERSTLWDAVVALSGATGMP
ncbi:MAG: SDR family NAD(P)-dependent oxidoreductase [Chloroflexi bacterium]|nr:SDR family NAD(P)-dependent oxidoreductase [Chloroflexota bacterium]